MSMRGRAIASLPDLLVVVPHSGLVVPAEIPLHSLAPGFTALLRNVDWYTHWLYDFRDLLDNRQQVFGYCPLLLEANRHPDVLDDCVPLRDVNGQPLYAEGQEPSPELRRLLAHKYLVAFHRQIEAGIAAGAELLLDGHSTVEARGVAANQIDLMSYQHTRSDDGPRHYSPPVYVETYAEELRLRLPEVRVTVNASQYLDVHGHVCAEHSVNAIGRVGKRAPAILQETCQHLYLKPDGSPDLMAMDRLRRAFAAAIRATAQRVRALRRAEKLIALHSLRQTFDFDCGAKALQTVFAYYGVEVREDVLLRELGADEVDGTSLQQMIAVSEARGFVVEAGPGWSIADIKRHIDEERPVIVLVQAWVGRYMNLRDWRNNWDDGHYAIVMGYNKDVLFFEDPSSFHTTWLKEQEFLARWHDQDPRTGEKLQRFGMVLRGREPAARKVAHME
ncbi:MAG: N-formylglutamate amidohydrolase [Deltaproteobacteria bacterium]|nr:N-formylglutamate amidohydrolase [Deltaproteobacteria bacterium]